MKNMSVSSAFKVDTMYRIKQYIQQFSIKQLCLFASWALTESQTDMTDNHRHANCTLASNNIHSTLALYVKTQLMKPASITTLFAVADRLKQIHKVCCRLSSLCGCITCTADRNSMTVVLFHQVRSSTVEYIIGCYGWITAGERRVKTLAPRTSSIELYNIYTQLQIVEMQWHKRWKR